MWMLAVYADGQVDRQGRENDTERQHCPCSVGVVGSTQTKSAYEEHDDDDEKKNGRFDQVGVEGDRVMVWAE